MPSLPGEELGTNAAMMEQREAEEAGPSVWYKMKRVPKHLPPRKLEELKKIVEIIRAYHQVEMIILFGSHARGDWVEHEYEEDHVTYEYRSDYDILVIASDKERERQINHDPELKRALQPETQLTRVNFIVHTIQHVNQMLTERRFFFMDIQKEGFVLYDSNRFKLARPPKELPPEVMLRHAEEYFAEWSKSADGFLKMARTAQAECEPKIAAFLLHQAAERFVTCLLLVQNGYRPKEHDTEKLIGQAASFDPRFSGIFASRTREERHLFDLLRRAYVDARYSKRYHVSEWELNAITERIEALKRLTIELCETRLNGLRSLVRNPVEQ